MRWFLIKSSLCVLPSIEARGSNLVCQYSLLNWSKLGLCQLPELPYNCARKLRTLRYFGKKLNFEMRWTPLSPFLSFLENWRVIVWRFRGRSLEAFRTLHSKNLESTNFFYGNDKIVDYFFHIFVSENQDIWTMTLIPVAKNMLPIRSIRYCKTKIHGYVITQLRTQTMFIAQ